jgi:GNAT superfamily N-acetyltransferase
MSNSSDTTKNLMVFRIAEVQDIPQIQRVRNSVKENMLSNPALVTDDDCREFITRRGKGWVCEERGQVLGFAIADLQEDNIWALFIHPEHEKKGIGSKLQQMMLDWYFAQNKKTVWLGTAPGTRAEKFYTASGWRKTGTNGPKEIKFELSDIEWKVQNNQ